METSANADCTEAAVDWCPPPARLHISYEHIHVWRFPVAHDPRTVEALCQWLPTQEQGRARRKRHAAARAHYVSAQVALRQTLAAYLERSPRALEFERGRHGKPRLRLDEGADSALEFNLSHAGCWVLLAVSRAGPVGVDIESLARRPRITALAKRYFTPDEAARLAATPEEQRPERFIRMWTFKEAYLKAIGTGLAGGLNWIDVDPEATPAVRWVRPPPPTCKRGWTFHPLPEIDGYAATLVRLTGAQVLHFGAEELPVPKDTRAGSARAP